jgi:hypothetical protein
MSWNDLGNTTWGELQGEPADAADTPDPVLQRINELTAAVETLMARVEHLERLSADVPPGWQPHAIMAWMHLHNTGQTDLSQRIVALEIEHLKRAQDPPS